MKERRDDEAEKIYIPIARNIPSSTSLFSWNFAAAVSLSCAAAADADHKISSSMIIISPLTHFAHTHTHKLNIRHQTTLLPHSTHASSLHFS
jgi:hypothetical protein